MNTPTPDDDDGPWAVAGDDALLDTIEADALMVEDTHGKQDDDGAAGAAAE